ncbi:hypothetical protein QMK33_14325 [Hymenobacter sp. H14-R3]|uniref:hypothetical protein n=1 Tax=Hymenobacter sp. H14-R3 TaxID=3046308 RepID=UPI0024BA85C1|nr:hypothetical protein [Hymenobacter sp. H14-R3]MDJ0366332.1 hypothetical protein [Hymenobacter sp. H14-R3]
MVTQYKEWLTATYSPPDIEALRIDAAGYPAWTEIERYVAQLLAQQQLASLSHADQVNLLYLIARNWDIGSLIGWLSPTPGSPLSNVGDLAVTDFLRLATTVVTLKHPALTDAKYQFAAACRKFSALTKELETVLHAFCQDPDAYTRSQAEQSLRALGYVGPLSAVTEEGQ